MMALKENGRLESERVRNLAIAARAGFADAESWESFLKESQSDL